MSVQGSTTHTSNHASTIDDPFLWGLLPFRLLFDSSKLRWSLGAKELLFNNALYSWYFRAGRVIPIVRGAGLNQEGVLTTLEKLERGEWIHIFPEGKVNYAAHTLLPLRWGIGKFVATPSAVRVPLVIPFYHLGLERITPKESVIYPIPYPFGKSVFILFGEPMCFDEILAKYHAAGSTSHTIYKAITLEVENELLRLKDRLISLREEIEKSTGEGLHNA